MSQDDIYTDWDGRRYIAEDKIKELIELNTSLGLVSYNMLMKEIDALK